MLSSQNNFNLKNGKNSLFIRTVLFEQFFRNGTIEEYPPN